MIGYKEATTCIVLRNWENAKQCVERARRGQAQSTEKFMASYERESPGLCLAAY
jgi:hypothetical protein